MARKIFMTTLSAEYGCKNEEALEAYFFKMYRDKTIEIGTAYPFGKKSVEYNKGDKITLYFVLKNCIVGYADILSREDFKKPENGFRGQYLLYKRSMMMIEGDSIVKDKFKNIWGDAPANDINIEVDVSKEKDILALASFVSIAELVLR